MSIRAQLALLAVLIAAPLIGLLALQSYREFQADAERAAQGVQRVARSAALDTRRSLDEIERVLKRLADHAAVRAMSPAQCDPAIEDFRATVSGFGNIITVSRGGELVCSAVQGKNLERSVGQLEWVRRALGANKPVVSSPTASVVTGEPVVYLSYPLEKGLIAVALQLASFDPVSEDHAFADDTVISIVDADGFMVARSTDARSWVGKNVRGQGVVDIALERRSGYVIAPGLMGVERVFGFAAVPGVPWVAYAGVRSEAVFAHARASAVRNGALAAVVVLVTGVLVVMLAERIARPIRAIAKTAAQVADGRLDGRAPVVGSGELAEVANEFNRMLDQRAESERLLQQVIDAVPAIIHVKDLEGRYGLVNREFERVTGLSAREAIGKHDAELFPPHVASVVGAHDREALARPGVLFVEETVNGRHYIAGKAALRDARGGARLLCTAAFNITERKQLEEQQLKLSRRVFEVSEEERQRLSRELHDRIGQPLAALRINIDVLRSKQPNQAPELDSQAALIEELIGLVRDLTAELRPPELEQIGLAAALRNYGEQASKRYGFAVDVLGGEFSPRLPRAAERALFRIAQEAVANAAKHAKAETVTIELDEAGSEAIVSVADDGHGFDTGRKREGFGLHTMHERAEEVGGRVEVESAENIGTRIIAAVPRSR